MYSSSDLFDNVLASLLSSGISDHETVTEALRAVAHFATQTGCVDYSVAFKELARGAFLSARP